MDLDQIEQDSQTPSGDITPVLNLANKMTQLIGKISKLEADKKELSQELKTITEQTLPEAMDACSLREFTLSNGAKIEIKPIIKGSLPSKGAIEKASEEDRPILEHRLAEGFRFLRNNNAGSLIKNSLVFDIGRGKDNVVSELEKIAEELEIPCERDESVHHGTLNSWINEKIDEGFNVPVDTFAIFNGRQAVVAKSSKKSKESKK